MNIECAFAAYKSPIKTKGKSMDKYLSTAPAVIKREINSNRYSGTDLEFLKHIQDRRTITLKQGIVLHNILSSNEVA